MFFRYANDERVECDWPDAPGYGIQTIVFVDPVNGPALRHQGDYYRLDDDGDVVAMDYDSLMRWLVDDLKIVKIGSMVSREKWKRIYQHGKEDLVELRESVG